jgi:nicotinamide N-methyltransferase
VFVQVAAVRGAGYSLFVEHIWPGCLVLADYLVNHRSLVADKTVLELGAGAALPSYVACKLGARRVVATDFPDPAVLAHITHYQKINACDNMEVLGHSWGNEGLHDIYDLVFLAEVLWKDTYLMHHALLTSLHSCLHPSGTALLALTHRPCPGHTKEHDLEFLTLARGDAFHLQCDLLFTSSAYTDAMDSTEQVEVFLYSITHMT